jgi:ribosomal protein L7Ae-like RNA K-turn-binding protein
LRFALAPEGTVTVDMDWCLPEPYVHLAMNRDVLEQAFSDKAFWAKHFDVSEDVIHIIPHYAAFIADNFKRKTLNSFALCNKAGLLTYGFEKVFSACKKEQFAVYLCAADAAEERQNKIKALQNNIFFINNFTESQLGRIIGRDSITHMVVKSGDLCLIGVQNFKSFLALQGKSQ